MDYRFLDFRKLRQSRRAQDVLEFEGSLWNGLAKMPGLLVLVTDNYFRLAWANSYFYEYFKCAPEDIHGRLMHEFLGEDTRDDMGIKHVHRILREGHVWDHYARTTDSVGEIIEIRWNQLAFTYGHRDRSQWILSVGFVPNSKTDTDKRTTMPIAEVVGFIGHDLIQDIYTREYPGIDNKELYVGVPSENYILHYQPRINARTKAIVGAECLIRMNHPEHGLLYPTDFLSGLERTGKIIEIGGHIIEMACRKLRKWQDIKTNLSISLNISPSQLFHNDFIQTLLSASAQIEPARLMLDITEQTIATHFHEAKKIITVLKGAGFTVSIDDVNCGYLPLSALAQLEVDNITIDPQYIVQAERDTRIHFVLESLIQLGRSLNMTVTANGIENRRWLDFMLENAVDYLQGYLISEPLPETEFDRFLETDPDFYTRHI